MRPTGGAIKTSELIAYFQAVLDKTTLPMMLVSQPGTGCRPLGAGDSGSRKARPYRLHQRESSRDLARVSRLIFEIEHAGHAQYFTTLQMWLATLALGGSGVTVPPPATLITRKIFNAFEAGDFKEAARLQGQLALFPARWMEFGLAAVMKAALAHLGIPVGGPVRRMKRCRATRSRSSWPMSTPWISQVSARKRNAQDQAAFHRRSQDFQSKVPRRSRRRCAFRCASPSATNPVILLLSIG